MVFDALVSHRFVFIGCVYAVGALTYLLSRASARAYARQTFIKQEEWRPPGIVGKAKSREAQQALPLIGATIVCLASLGLDRTGVEIILGGFFCVQLLALAGTIGNLITVRALDDPASAQGAVTYAASYRYRSLAGYTLAAATLAALAFALSGSPAFIGAFVITLATAAGYTRRARQAAKARQT